VAEERVPDGGCRVVDEERGDRGDAGPPPEREPEHARGLGLPAVDPEQRGHDRPDGHECGHDPHQLREEPDTGRGHREEREPTGGESDEPGDRQEDGLPTRCVPMRRPGRVHGGHPKACPLCTSCPQPTGLSTGKINNTLPVGTPW
jgi:hypothetical protein